MVVLRDVRLRSRHDTGHCHGNSSGHLVRICPSSQPREYIFFHSFRVFYLSVLLLLLSSNYIEILQLVSNDLLGARLVDVHDAHREADHLRWRIPGHLGRVVRLHARLENPHRFLRRKCMSASPKEKGLTRSLQSRLDVNTNLVYIFPTSDLRDLAAGSTDSGRSYRR